MLITRSTDYFSFNHCSNVNEVIEELSNRADELVEKYHVDKEGITIHENCDDNGCYFFLAVETEETKFEKQQREENQKFYDSVEIKSLTEKLEKFGYIITKISCSNDVEKI